MSTWLTEKEFRQSGAEASGVTLNVAFLQEIKNDNLPVRQQVRILTTQLAEGMSPKSALGELLQFRDNLETYFALEEFYGYFQNAEVGNPTVSNTASTLKNEHESLFLKLNDLIELTEQIVYRECGSDITIIEVSELFDNFSRCFESHEQQEMDLMMRLCNEEIGVGD